MKRCINKGCSYYRKKRKNKCKKIPYRYSVDVCECHADDDGFSVKRPKGEPAWQILHLEETPVATELIGRVL